MRSIIPRFAAMAALIAFGLVLAVAHHLSYSFLSGKSTADYPQIKVKAIALAVAFIIKSSFATTIGMAFQETAWNAVRKRYTNIKTLDTVFASQSNVLSFFSADAFRTAFAALLLSGLRWSMPIAAILPPGSLNVRVATHRTINGACRVPTFNNSLGRTWFPGGLGIKINGTPDLDKWNYQTVVSNETAFMSSDSFCGSNCSYTQSFVGPHMECRYTDVDVGKSNDIAAPKPPNQDYNICDLDNRSQACYLAGSAAIHDSANDGPKDTFTMSYAESWQRIDKCRLRMNYTRIVCGYTQAHYNLSIAYVNNVPRYNATITPFKLPDTFHPDYYKEPTVEEEDLWDLEVTARGLFHYFQGIWLSGKIQLYSYSAGFNPVRARSTIANTARDIEPCFDDLRVLIRSQTALTPLIEIQNFTIHPARDLTALIPELFRNFTISTFQLNPRHTNFTSCTLETTEPLYSYEPVGLLVSYGIATVLSIGCALCGLRSLHANGGPTKPIFRQFVNTYNVNLGGTVEMRSGHPATDKKDPAQVHLFSTCETQTGSETLQTKIGN